MDEKAEGENKRIAKKHKSILQSQALIPKSGCLKI
jgi:hypothetical protein